MFAVSFLGRSRATVVPPVMSAVSSAGPRLVFIMVQLHPPAQSISLFCDGVAGVCLAGN